MGKFIGCSKIIGLKIIFRRKANHFYLTTSYISYENCINIYLKWLINK